MNVQSVELLTPEQLSRLLDIDARVCWGNRDSAAALRHQLSTPLLPDLAGLCDAASEASPEIKEQTFLEQLTAAHPNLDMLWGIKRFARQMRDEDSSPLKGGPATVLYYSAIARAQFCLNARIAQLTDDQIQEGCKWAIDQEGAEELKIGLAEAMKSLERS